ncbi:DUF72 domain-containing protein [Paraburkholderia silviterrae]|uniref:DUF72 domain-containing protein n=1 Tax=Paraburkholderia silviterrae TaxID=2528715 RepID=A0A4R5M2U4_9BURK|nr:DUF72 domain-containing protein [Paraburkholderia silviterrae]TDG19265.1 DUF72 domain-containing protein [Paraburkholderia silviterrae]
MNERDDGLFGALENDGSGAGPQEDDDEARSATRPSRQVGRTVERRNTRAAHADAQPDTQTDLFGFVPPEPREPQSGRAARRKAADAAAAESDGDDESVMRERPTQSKAAKPAQSAPDSPDSPAPRRRAKGVLPAIPDQGVLDLAAELPPGVRLGTSSWSFPGWRGIIYGDDYSNSKLAREGLAAYGAHPLLRSVSIDRSFYAPLTVTDYLRYAQQVPDHFRFIVKAPALITDASVRGDRGEPVSANPCFLNADLAAREFVEPCLAGLGAKAGALVFQFPPLPDQLLADPAAFVERLAAFLAALPPLPKSNPAPAPNPASAQSPEVSDASSRSAPSGDAPSSDAPSSDALSSDALSGGTLSSDAPSAGAPFGDGPCYAVEIRDGILLTPRFVRTLRAAGVRYCVGLHARMPDPLRQAAALALMDGEAPAGPLIVRWSLHSGFKYEQAKARYEPFDKLVDEDPHTRDALAELAARYAIAGQPVLITTNNKAEGSAPLTCAKLARAIADEMLRMRSESASTAE